MIEQTVKILRRNRFASGLAVGIIGVILFYISYTSLHNPCSFGGHVIRWMRGEWGGKQITDDLAKQLEQTKIDERLQSWAVKVMERFDGGDLKTLPYEAPWGPVVKLNAQDVPVWVTNQFRDNPDYEIIVESGRAESVLIDWNSHGIVIGNTNFYIKTSRWDGHYNVPVKAGVFVVWYDYK